MSIKNRLWGYDFFISYHWASGGGYAVELARVLGHQGYECFLDRAEYAIGDDWKRMGELALRNTQRLIVVATQEAVAQSLPVARELEIFSERSRHVIPIVFGTGFSDEDRRNYPTLRFFPDSQLFIAEEARNLKFGPSPTTVDQLVRTRGVLRRRVLRSRIVTGVIAILLLAVVVVSMFWHQSDADRAEAERQTRYAVSRHLAIESQRLLDSRPRLGLLLASEAVLATTRAGERPTVEALESLSQAIGVLGGIPAEKDDEAQSLAISPDGRWLVRGWQLWSLSENGRSGRPIRLHGRVDPQIHFNRVIFTQFSPDGNWLLTLNSGHNVEPLSACLWDLRSSTLAEDSPFQLLNGIDSAFGPRCFGFSGDGQWLAIGDHLWNLRPPAGKGPRLWRLPNAAGAVTFSGDSRWLATGGNRDGSSLGHLWNLKADDPTKSTIHLPGLWYNGESLLFSSDNHWLITRGSSGPGLLWDLTGESPGTRSLVLKNDGGDPSWLTLDPKGRWLISGGAWDLTSKDPTQAAVERLAFKPTTGFSPDGNWLLVGETGITKLLDLRKATLPQAPSIRLDFQVLTLGSGFQAEAAFVFSPDGRWFAFRPLGFPHVYLLNLQSDDPKAGMLRIPAALGTKMVFSPDGRWLFTQDYDIPLNADVLMMVAARVSLRNLTVEEWKRYLPPTQAYRRTFDALPAPYNPDVPDEFRSVAPDDLNRMAWDVVRQSGRPMADYRLALRQSLSASGRNFEDLASLNTLGVALYRNERYAEAQQTLLACAALRKEFRPPANQIHLMFDEPCDYAFLTMAAHRLGRRDEAAFYLKTLRERFKDSRQITEDDQAFLRETESVVKDDPPKVNR